MDRDARRRAVGRAGLVASGALGGRVTGRIGDGRGAPQRGLDVDAGEAEPRALLADLGAVHGDPGGPEEHAPRPGVVDRGVGLGDLRPVGGALLGRGVLERRLDLLLRSGIARRREAPGQVGRLEGLGGELERPLHQEANVHGFTRSDS